MKNVLVLLIHLLTVVAKLLGPGGIKGIIAENLLLKQQLLVVRRPRHRAPNLFPSDRFLFGFFSLFLRPKRIPKAAVGIRPSTLLLFHDYLVRRKYRFGYPRIASIISKTFGIEIDRNVVRRVLAKYYRPEYGGNGPTWLAFLGHMKDSLWSIDLFRCASLRLTKSRQSPKFLDLTRLLNA